VLPVWHVLLPALFAAAGQALEAPRVSLEELTQRAEWIARARCVRTWEAADEETQRVWTHAELEVAEALKGEMPRTVVVSEPQPLPNEPEGYTKGAPRYTAGEGVLVFLYRTPLGLLRTVGLGQGKFTLLAEPSTGEFLVRTNTAGMPLAPPAGPARIRGIEHEKLDGLKLSELRGLIEIVQIRQAKERR